MKFQVPLCASLVLLVTALSIALAPPRAEAAQPAPLLVPVGPKTTGPGLSDPTIVRERRVAIDRRVLPAADTAPNQFIRLNLFPDVTVDAFLEQCVYRNPASYSWLGSIAEDPDASFILTVEGNTAAANVRLPKRGSFLIRYEPDGLYAVQEIDETQFPPCATGTAEVPGPPPPDAKNHPFAAKDSGAVIDVMVVYTPSARSAVGGTAAMEALINLAIDESNDAYLFSNVTPRLRLVHTTEVAYTESSSFSTDLDRLRNAADGFMDNVHTLRNTYGADLVSLIINNSSSCGIAYLLPALNSFYEAYGFSVVHHSCATGYYSFAHELGHNMGCAHDRDNATSGLFSYSFGHRFTGVGGTQYRTIMAYAPGTRIQRFSNPDVLFDGVATGVTLGTAGEAHNALTINNSANTIANYRQTVDVLQISPAGGLVASGPAGGPFAPGSIVYTLTNASAASLDWTAVKTAAWLDLSSTGGTLAAGANTDVTVSFNAQANALGAGVHNDTVTFTNVTGGTDIERAVTLTVQDAPPGAFAWFPLDSDPGWSKSTGWAFGQPLGGGTAFGDPTSGYTGLNVYGYNLSGDYTNNMPQRYLRMPVQDCTGRYNVKLRFYRWLAVENSAYDFAKVQISTNDSTWTDVWVNPADAILADNAWSEQVLDISQWADNQPTVYIRWVMGPTDGDTTFPGWNLDDIALTASDLSVSPETRFAPTGPSGGPFAPADTTYTLTNEGAAPLDWSASVTAPWLDLSSTGGTLAGAANTGLIVSLNAAADSLPPGVYTDTLSITNLANGVQVTRPIRFAVAGPPPGTVHWFPLDTDPGWTRQGDWAFGTPTGGGSGNGDPSAAFTGSNVFGNNLNGNYPNAILETYLTTGPLDCRGYENLMLSFWRWLGVEHADYDGAKIEVSTNGTQWQPVWTHSGATISDSDWTHVSYDISTADNQPTVYIRWTMGPTDEIISYPGWNLDDIAISGSALAPEIDVAPLSLDFGNQPLGNGPTFAQSVVITNVADGILSLSNVALAGTSPSQFSIMSDTGETQLYNQETRTIELAFDPDSAGALDALLRIESNDADEAITDVTLAGTGTDPEIDINPTSADFGNQPVAAGSTAATAFTITNTGTADLTLTSVGLVGADAGAFAITSDSGESTLAPSAIRTVQVAFDPEVAGAHTAALQIASDDADEGTVDLPLSGTGTEPDIAVTPASGDFGSQAADAGPTAETVFTIENAGDADLAISSVSITGAGAAAFAIQSDSGETTLAPAAVRTVGVVFDPDTAGTFEAALAIASDDPDQPLVERPLTGTGLDVEIDAVPAALDFGSRDIDDGPSAALSVDIANIGIDGLLITGVTIEGTDAAAFQIDSDTGELSLLASEARTIGIVFDPGSTGAKAAVLRVTSNDLDEPVLDVPLSGTGIDQEIAVTPAALNFGTQDIDGGPSAGQEVVIMNAGSATLAIASVALEGADAAAFAIASDTGDTQLLPGAFRLLTVTFDPAAEGPATAILRITSDDTDEPVTDVALSGIGLAAIWVDFAHDGIEAGTELEPFNTLAEALAAAGSNGIIRIKSGASTERPRITTPVRLLAPYGSARIGI